MSDLVIVFKNFKRYDFLSLSIKSAIHFVGSENVFCVDIYPEERYSEEGYKKIPLPKEQIFSRKTKYHGGDSSVNCQFFSEGHNFAYEAFKDYNGKVLSINEDHFFTNGETIKELKNESFDLAWANWVWPDLNSVNGSFLCFVPYKCSQLFPLPEKPEFVDKFYYNHIINGNKDRNLVLYKVKNREGEDYKGDGIRTNDFGTAINYIKQTLPVIL